MAITLTSRATVYDRYAISRKFTAQETAINVVQGSINLFASESEITELKNGDKTMYSKLSSVEIDLKSITLAVSSSEYQDINGVLSAITQARASITLNTQQIELKVSKDSIVSTINQSAEAVKINANKIALTGNGIIDILNTGTTTISASRISLEGLTTINGNFKVLTDGSMEAKNGRFSGNITGGSAYLDAKYLSAGSDNVQLMIAGTGPVDRCVLSDSTLQFTNGSFFGIDSNMIMIKLERESGIKNQVRINNNVNGHPAMMLYENSVLKTSVSGNGISSGEIHSTGNLYGEYLIFGRGNTPGNLTIGGYAFVNNLSVTGMKNRVVKTKNFGTVAQSAYETAEPMFGDIGHGVISENGECTIFIDPKFGETVSTEYGYYVFITKYAGGDAWVSKKELSTFTISGTPGLEFDWEIKAHQKGYESDRLRTVEIPNEVA